MRDCPVMSIRVVSTMVCPGVLWINALSELVDWSSVNWRGCPLASMVVAPGFRSERSSNTISIVEVETMSPC